jgi:hypothetical protein
VPAAALEGAETDVAATSGTIGTLAAAISCDLTVLVRAVGGSKNAPSHCSCCASRVRRLTTPYFRRALGVACGLCLRSRSARISLRSRRAWRAWRARWARRWVTPRCAGATTAPQDCSGPPPPQQVGHARARRIEPIQRRLSSDLRAAASATPPRSASIASGPRSSSKGKKLRNYPSYLRLYLNCRVGICNNKEI